MVIIVQLSEPSNERDKSAYPLIFAIGSNVRSPFYIMEGKGMGGVGGTFSLGELFENGLIELFNRAECESIYLYLCHAWAVGLSDEEVVSTLIKNYQEPG